MVKRYYEVKRIYDFEKLQVGKEYHVRCGNWEAIVEYVGSCKVGSRTKYRFTMGSAQNWRNQFGFFQCKSALAVYEII